MFNLVKENYLKKGILAGANFWAWGGFAKQNKDHVFWEKGNDYMGDPAQEEQGLYSVFHSDNTVGIISEFNKEMQDKTN